MAKKRKRKKPPIGKKPPIPVDKGGVPPSSVVGTPGNTGVVDAGTSAPSSAAQPVSSAAPASQTLLDESFFGTGAGSAMHYQPQQTYYEQVAATTTPQTTAAGATSSGSTG